MTADPGHSFDLRKDGGSQGTTQVASKLTAKAWTTIPREVRERLALRPGDTIVYEIEGDAVRLRKLAPVDVARLRAPRATLSEWETPEDAADSMRRVEAVVRSRPWARCSG